MIGRGRAPVARRATFWFVCALVATGCRVDLFVDVSVTKDGSGIVTVQADIDRDVADEVPDLAQILRLDDLRSAGWRVDVGSGRSGSVIVTATKPFDAFEQVSGILGEIDGPEGMFPGASLRLERNAEVTTYRLEVDLNLDRTVLDFTDPNTGEVLGGEPFGVPLEELEARIGGPLDSAVSVAVSGRVPGGEARVPSAGALSLTEPGTRQLVVTGTIIDDELLAAIDDAADARSKVPGTIRLVMIWWAVLALLAGAILFWRRRHRRVRVPTI